MKRLRNVNGNTTYIYKEISFITILDVTTRRQSIANPPMEDSYGRLHMNIDVREIKQVVNILHISRLKCVCLSGCSQFEQVGTSQNWFLMHVK